MYQLHQRLQQDTFYLGQLTLCDVLLMNDARYPWVILVPRREDITEIHQLNEADQQQLMTESVFVAKQLSSLVSADKMNIAALGNVVSQLHIHHVARYQSDEAWPSPIWGKGDTVSYSPDEAKAVAEQLKMIFSELLRDGG
jgi:diadenosine tetraphosphate (Ap4A) HIT family hydrolase